MSCPDNKEECSAPPAKQPRVAEKETEEKGRKEGALDTAASQEAQAAQALCEMTNWRDTGDPTPPEEKKKKKKKNPERGPEEPNGGLPVCTPERGDTGESARGMPHVPEGGETAEKNPSLRKPADKEPVEPYRRNGQKNRDGKGTEEPAVLSPLSSDSGERNSCSEGDECCIVSVGTQPPTNDRSLQALETVQEELRAVNERADRALLQLKRRYGQLRKPHIQKRNSIIRAIPGFWVTAVS